MTDVIFNDRRQAGHHLAVEVRRQELSNPIVLAVARGGVPVACEIAEALEAPLDVIVVRKLTSPGQPHAAFGAITADGTHAYNEDLMPDRAGLDSDTLSRTISVAREELQKREDLYRHGRPFPDIADRDVVLVGDGMATGVMMLVAARIVRSLGAAHVVVAVPATSDYAFRRLLRIADDVICLDNPEAFLSVGCSYRNFEPIRDEDICRLLDEFSHATGESGALLETPNFH